MRLKGKTALISGAGRGNGKAIAITFAREGADLILIAKERIDSLNQVTRECESLGVKVLPLLADVGKHEEVNRVVKLGLERFGKVDQLVCAAAVRHHRFLWDYDYDEWHQMFAVSLHSTFYFVKALAPGMMERKSGSIIAMAGGSALTSMAQRASETTRGHGLYGLIKSLALDLAPHGIRANLLVLWNVANQEGNPSIIKPRVRDPEAQLLLSPMRRTGTMQEVANAAVFLASEESSYITGDRICCTGGRFM